MMLFLGGLCLGISIGVVIMEALSARDDDPRKGHPL